MKLWVYQLLGTATFPLFKYCPKVYFNLYSFYKKKSDSYKLAVLRNHIKPGDTVIDIGAHIGFYSRFFAGLVGQQGKVFAFEPDPENFKRLSANIKSFPSVKIISAAVSSVSGRLKLFRSKTLSVDQHAYPTPGRKSVTVESAALDDFVKKENVKINFIKMDIQGFEIQALQGMKEILATHRPKLLTEFWPWGIEQAKSPAERMIELLNTAGYSIQIVDEKNKQLKDFNFSTITYGHNDYYDLFCVPI